ncbi:GAF domain-containing protein, partial [Mycobacteroides abscessus]
MAREWLLLETLGDEPTVIASGSQPRNMVPLSTFLRRNRNLGLLRRVITAATKANKALTIGPPDSDS